MSVGDPKKLKILEALEKDLKIAERIEKEADNARLYKTKDSRIKKELSFATKKNRSKLT